jgi:hypothetical protein
MLAQAIPVLGRAPDRFPQEYWAIQAEWNAARDNKNSREIIRTGEAQIKLFLGDADPARAAREWRRTGDVALNVLAGVMPVLTDEYIAQKDLRNIARMVTIGWPVVEQHHILNNRDMTHVRARYYRLEHYPAFFWLEPEYRRAVDRGNDRRIIEAGEELINHMLGGRTSERRARDWLRAAQADRRAEGEWAETGRWELSTLQPIVRRVRDAHLAVSNPDRIAAFLDIAWPIEEAWQLRDDRDGIAFVRDDYRNRKLFYNVPADVYVEMPGGRGDIINYGAKHEPSHGVLFGEIATYRHRYDFYKARQTPMYDESSVHTIYVRFDGDSRSNRFEHFDHTIRPEIESGRPLHFAWNLSNEGEALDLVLRSRSQIESEAKYMASLGVPIFLRFGAEMNIWSKAPDPKKYIEAFRFVTDIVRRHAPNVAMVWSISSIGRVGSSYDTFYPGDDYVDWVGISLYTNKYHVGRSDQSADGQAIFMTGKYANPVNLIKRLVDEYGDRKPVMVSEGGVENYSNSLKRDETDFALKHMRLMYEFIPIVYPQVKLMILFNECRSGEEPANYALYTPENVPSRRRVMARYAELTRLDHFIKFGQKAADVSYRKLGGDTARVPASKVTLVTYAPYLMYDNVIVNYYLNDERLSSSTGGDARQTFDLSRRRDGRYTLRVEVREGSTRLKILNYSLEKTGDTVALRPR